jgi:RNA polymerase sigma-70 factor, ECF subfamily
VLRGRRVALRDGENVIGRDATSNVCLDHPSVSRRHARLFIDGTTARLDDLGSRNGTTLRGNTVTTPVTVESGDRIVFGSVAAVFRALAPSGRADGPTELLLAWNQGDSQAFDRLVPLVHDELRRIARQYMARERPGHTLQASALVNEAYLRLIDLKQMQWQNRAHFFAMSARLMRRILVDFARARRNDKRGGGAPRITLDEAQLPPKETGLDVVALHDALLALAAVLPRKSDVVELRYFGGLSLEETAEALHLSVDTVKRDWRFAKAWLLRELEGKP